ncbi:MAG: hypothetical protein QOF01_3240 [Thermomicrobiales bacterium]|jgi:hypothetical protein|nr:hypothetical protein [Thermomicrobiales bacterium]
MSTEVPPDEGQWWASMDASYAALRSDPATSAEYDAEMAVWDTVLIEGLEEWPQDGIEELLRAIDGKPQP